MPEDKFTNQDPSWWSQEPLQNTGTRSPDCLPAVTGEETKSSHWMADQDCHHLAYCAHGSRHAGDEQLCIAGHIFFLYKLKRIPVPLGPKPMWAEAALRRPIWEGVLCSSSPLWQEVTADTPYLGRGGD